MWFAKNTSVSAGRIHARASATWALAVFCIAAYTSFGSYIANCSGLSLAGHWVPTKSLCYSSAQQDRKERK